MFIGAAKCATSTLFNLLRQHPDVFILEETDFFSKDEVYNRGFNWYESLYGKANDKKMRGEASNKYTMKEVFPKTVSRIASYAPELKLIYIVRDPIARIESFWLQKRSHGGEHGNFEVHQSELDQCELGR